ncbi:hypothetical protein BDA99DRAFT_582583, partial [Phascolomyces articulosus]
LLARSLSIQGRGLIANSLLLSKVWNCIRILPITKTYLRQLHSIIYKFVTRKAFPPVSFATCTGSRKEGELAVLDPLVQHPALQLRWVLPLLEAASTEESNSFIFTFIHHCLQLYSQASSPLYPILFSEHLTLPLTSLSSLKSLFYCIGSLKLSPA